jgi:hypothetical protein
MAGVYAEFDGARLLRIRQHRIAMSKYDTAGLHYDIDYISAAIQDFCRDLSNHGFLGESARRVMHLLAVNRLRVSGINEYGELLFEEPERIGGS